MPISLEKKSINYTEYFFDLVDIVDSKKPNNKIKTIGLGECYYNTKDNDVILYKNKRIEVLKDTYLGGKYDPVNNKYERHTRHISMKDASKNTTLILSRVGEHLFDFHHQIYDIYQSGIADSVIMLLPDMSKVVGSIDKNIKKCKLDNCFNFDFDRDMLELLSSADLTLSDLHRVYTSPKTIDTLLYPCSSMGMFSYIESMECGYKINGYEHFIVFIEFDKTSKCKFTPTLDSPKFDFYENGLDANGIYTMNGSLYQKLDGCLNIEGIVDHIDSLNSCDAIIFNKIMSKSNEINVFYLYNICKYIKPGTKIIIIEDDMLKIVRDIENDKEIVVSSEQFWYLNSLLFGLGYQSIPSDKLAHIDYCNQFFMTPDILDVMMTQECLYKKSSEEERDIIFQYADFNPYTFQQSYVRL